jgi:hypothetical protein
MIAKDKARTFLAANRGRTFCDPCLGRAVGIDPSTGHRAATRIARAEEFLREYGVCSGCGESRLVTRATLVSERAGVADSPGTDPSACPRPNRSSA